MNRKKKNFQNNLKWEKMRWKVISLNKKTNKNNKKSTIHIKK